MLKEENKDYFTLSELAGLISATILSEFSQPLRVLAEVSSISERNGHIYLDLVESDDRTGHPKAKMRAIIWRDYRFIVEKFQEVTGQEFSAGLKYMFVVNVNYHQVYGLSLFINDIDVVYSLGELYKSKLAAIKMLKQKGIFDHNKKLYLPLVIKRIAIISSESAAGYQDFIHQLENNEYGFVFEYELFSSFVQGEMAEGSLLEALNQANKRKQEFDVLVIIRGGGSQLDLRAFDSALVSEKVARFPLPVLTGIGHTKDISVVDQVAFRALKTPTAVAQFIINRNLDFFNILVSLHKRLEKAVINFLERSKIQLQQTGADLEMAVNRRFWNEKNFLQQMHKKLLFAPKLIEQHYSRLLYLSQSLTNGVKKFFTEQNQELKHLIKDLRYSTNNFINEQKQKLRQIETIIQENDPKKMLRKGYSITLVNGKAVVSINQVKTGDLIQTLVFDGEIFSEVKQTKPEN